MDFPKFVYRKANNEKGYEAILCNSLAALEVLEGVSESPADLGIETHPVKEAKPADLGYLVAAEPVKKKRGKA